MRKKLIISFIIIVILSLFIGFYYITKQSNTDHKLDQMTPENNEVSEDIEEPNKSDKESKVEKEQLKSKISSTLKNTLEFIFTKKIHVVAIGDSLTQGVGDSTKNGGYIGILDKTINEQRNIVTFENYGKSGRRTDQLLEALKNPEVIKSIKQTDMILMTIGANDIMKVVQQNFTNLTYSLFIEEQMHFENRLNDIFMEIKRINPDAHIYLLGLYNPFEQYFQDIEELDLIVDSWNETGERTTEKYNHAIFIPIKDLFDETTINLFADDHFHPNEIGYERMAERVLEYLIDGEW